MSKNRPPFLRRKLYLRAYFLTGEIQYTRHKIPDNDNKHPRFETEGKCTSSIYERVLAQFWEPASREKRLVTVRKSTASASADIENSENSGGCSCGLRGMYCLYSIKITRLIKVATANKIRLRWPRSYTRLFKRHTGEYVTWHRAYREGPCTATHRLAAFITAEFISSLIEITCKASFSTGKYLDYLCPAFAGNPSIFSLALITTYGILSSRHEWNSILVLWKSNAMNVLAAW